MRGIAFPTPPPSQTRNYYLSNEDITDLELKNDESYLTGWISVLEQLANDSDINTIRLYELDCRFNYSSFINRAAKLGIYVIIPLTTISGPGVLSRTNDAPYCYPNELFHYGTTCLSTFWDYPNVVAGVVGNEVMDNLKAWRAAPCVKAYLDDLARYSNNVLRYKGNTRRQSFPLLYATQHDSPSAEQLPDEAIKLTFDYLSCRSAADEADKKYLDNTILFGINIESWCSSLQTFEYEENGVDESSYHSLWRTLFKGFKTETTMDAVTGEITTYDLPTISPKPLNVPIVFSEMGCSKYLFNRDNGLQQPSLARDWKQIPVVLKEPMSKEMSGFIAYGYDGGGNGAFRMMGDGNAKWDGVEPLPTSEDYDNFCTELSSTMVAEDLDDNNITMKSIEFIACEEISSKLENLWDVELFSIEKMPSYSREKRTPHASLLVDEAAGMMSLHKIDAVTATIVIFTLGILLLVKQRITIHNDHYIILSSDAINYGSLNNN